MRRLSDFTSARVDLGRTGDSLPTAPLLAFRLAHARARDAVHSSLDGHSLQREMTEQGWCSRPIHTAAADRQEYLQRPDRGRQLDDSSIVVVRAVGGPCANVFGVADGLSASAVHRHAIPLLQIVLRELAIVPDSANPLWIIHQARVAVADHVGELLGATLSVLLIGERPGLSSPDSLGVYLTSHPRRGRTDSERNCISNIHAQGLSYEEAAHKLLFLIRESRRRGISGVALKEEAGKAQTLTGVVNAATEE